MSNSLFFSRQRLDQDTHERLTVADEQRFESLLRDSFRRMRERRIAEFEQPQAA
jgi:hypothetical protein